MARQKAKKPARVREPVQVYLDRPDRELLDQMAEQSGESRAELLRRGLRKLAGDVLTERPPGWSFDELIGALGEDQPSDLSVRHDHYLAEALEAELERKRRGRPRAR